MCLDAAALGDIPARYVIPSLPNYEFPVVGVYVDPRVVPGFMYKVRVLPEAVGNWRNTPKVEKKMLSVIKVSFSGETGGDFLFIWGQTTATPQHRQRIFSAAYLRS